MARDPRRASGKPQSRESGRRRDIAMLALHPKGSGTSVDQSVRGQTEWENEYPHVTRKPP